MISVVIIGLFVQLELGLQRAMNLHEVPCTSKYHIVSMIRRSFVGTRRAKVATEALLEPRHIQPNRSSQTLGCRCLRKAEGGALGGKSELKLPAAPVLAQ